MRASSQKTETFFLPDHIDGVKLISLSPHRDKRGCFTEIFREEWNVGVKPIQWNCVASKQNVLRGVHVHLTHMDYWLIASGKALLGIADLRSGSPTEGKTTVIELGSEKPCAAVIPQGVAHGFYFLVPSLHIYSVSHYWNLEDEIGCLWNDPDLNIPWKIMKPELSERDAHLPQLREIQPLIPPYNSAKIQSVR